MKLDSKSDFVVIKTKHNKECAPDFFKNKVRAVVSELTEEVGVNYAPTQQQYENKMAALKNKGPSAEIPVYRSLKTRKPSEVVIPEEFKSNLLVDFNQDGNRIIILVSPKVRKEIKNVHHYLCDGTFDCCPVPIKEIFTIHGDVGEADDQHTTNIVPMFYVLLTNKTKSTYEIMFVQITEALTDFNPQKFTLDFEVATMSAIEEVFPEAVIHGCFVHFQRSIYIQEGEILGPTEP